MTASDLAWNISPLGDRDFDQRCTDLVVVSATSSAVMAYDAEFAKKVRSPKVETEPETVEPPDFPGFEPDTDFSRWVHDQVFTEDIAEISAIFGTSTPRTYRRLTAAMTAIHGLPRFADRVREENSRRRTSMPPPTCVKRLPCGSCLDWTSIFPSGGQT